MGTDGAVSVYPFWGSFKRYAQNFSSLARSQGLIAVWALALGCLAAGLLGFAAFSGYGLPSWWVVAGLAAVAGVAERQGVRITSSVEVSVSFLPAVFTAVAFGPLAAGVVMGLANLSDFRRPYLRWAVYTPARVITGVAAGFAASSVLNSSGSNFGRVLVASLAAGAANFIVDVLISSATLLIRQSGGSPLSVLRAVGPLNLVSLPLYVPLVALLAYIHEAYSMWVVATFFLPAVALQRLIHLYQQQRDATTDLAAANQRLEAANLSFAAALIATLDARDRYTAGHSAAVAIYSRDIAEGMGLSAAEQDLAHLAGLVHDIGKVGLPPGLLEKEGPLSLEERRVMEQHSVIGERILANVADYAEVASIVRHHHERFDGEGYPDKLATEEIPVLSRIIGVADAYNAMTSDRPYRDAMPSRVARLRLAQSVGSQFDISVVAVFEAILAASTEEYRTGSGARFERGSGTGDRESDQLTSPVDLVREVA